MLLMAAGPLLGISEVASCGFVVATGLQGSVVSGPASLSFVGFIAFVVEKMTSLRIHPREPFFCSCNAMVETARQLYEKHTQSGAPSMTMMARIEAEMSDMNFHVTKGAAVFATEAHIHQMCAVAKIWSRPAASKGRHTPWSPTWAPRGSRSGRQPDQPGHQQDATPVLRAGDMCAERKARATREGAPQYGYPTPGYGIMRS
jgi:hypothetical protein